MKFKVDFDNWKDINIETAKFYFTESEKRLKETITTYNNTSASANKVLSIVLPSTLILISYILNKSSQNNFLDARFLTAIAVLLVLTFAILKILNILKPRNLQTVGSQPNLLINKEPILRHGKSELQLIDIMLINCENFQERIEQNIKLNESRAMKLHFVYNLVSIWIPIVATIIYMLANHFAKIGSMLY